MVSSAVSKLWKTGEVCSNLRLLISPLFAECILQNTEIYRTHGQCYNRNIWPREIKDYREPDHEGPSRPLGNGKELGGALSREWMIQCAENELVGGERGASAEEMD